MNEWNWKNRTALAVLIIIGLLLCIAIAYSEEAHNHALYDKECCNERDCRSLPCAEFKPNGIGWRHEPTGIVFLRSQLKPSRDGRCHGCWNASKNPLCVYFPLGS